MSTEKKDLKNEALSDKQLDDVSGGLQLKEPSYLDEEVNWRSPQGSAIADAGLCPVHGTPLEGRRENKAGYTFEGICRTCGLRWIVKNLPPCK